MTNVKVRNLEGMLVRRNVELHTNVRQELASRPALLGFVDDFKFLTLLRNDFAYVLTQFLGIANAPVRICLALENPVAQERRDVSGLKGRNQPLVLKDCGLRERLTKFIGIHAYSLDVKFIILADLVSTTYRRNNC